VRISLRRHESRVNVRECHPNETCRRAPVPAETQRNQSAGLHEDHPDSYHAGFVSAAAKE
jgi:phage baseplate assembly protein W